MAGAGIRTCNQHPCYWTPPMARKAGRTFWSALKIRTSAIHVHVYTILKTILF